MTLSAILNPIPTFTDAKGSPITGGSIYIGVSGLDPETNPQACYWDAAGATPASQPLQVKGGFVVNGTTPAQFFTSAPFSIRVYDAFGAVVYYKTSISQATGAGLISAATGGTVEDAIWHKGRTAPIAGSKAQVNWVRDDALAPIENMGGLWSANVVIDHGIDKVFDATAGAAGAPVTAFMAKVKNTGTSGDAVGLMAVAEVAATGKDVFGANIIAYSSGGAQNCKLVGLEIDLQPQAGTTPASAAGLYLNAFTMTMPGPAIYLEGVFGGKWGTGISVGNLATNGAGIGPANGNPTMGALVDSGTAQYQTAAIKLNNTHRQIFNGATGNPAQLYTDASNFFRIVSPAAGFVFRDTTDTASLTFIDPANGSVDIQGAGVFKKSSVQVVGARQTGWGAATGGSKVAFNGATATLAQTSAALAQVIADLTTHGLIGA